MRSCFNSPKLFQAGGRVWQAFGLPCAGRSVAHAQAFRRFCRFQALKTPPVLPFFRRHFEGGLAIVAGLAQALQIVPVNEAGPVASVGLDVVHHRGPGAYAPSGALPAPRLTQELIGPQVVRPDGQTVPAVPLGGHPAPRPLGLMPGAVSLSGELRASWVPAWSERLHGHGLSPPGKTKSQSPTTSHAGIMSGSGSQSTGLCRCLPLHCACSFGSRQ